MCGLQHGFCALYICLARNIVTLVPRDIVGKINELNQDIEKFSRGFNGSQNKGNLYAASLIGRKEGRKEIVIEEYSSYRPERIVRR